MPMTFTLGDDSFTVTSTFGERLAERLEPIGTPDLGRVCQAIGAMVDPILALSEEQGSDGEAGFVAAWNNMLDPTAEPFASNPTLELSRLAYLGQYVGVALPKTITVPEARALIKEQPGQARGTRGAVESAIRRTLGTGVPFTLEERTAATGEEDPYHFVVIVPPGKGSGALIDAITAVKPAGVFFTIVEVEDAWVAAGKTWEEVAGTVTWNSAKEGEV